MQALVKRVNDAIQDFKNGKMVILTDHPSRENEGDLIIPAEMITPDIMNFIIRNSSGIVCISMLEEQLKKLDLPLMLNINANTSIRHTPFTISVDAKENITTGVSADDRTYTIKTLIRDDVKSDDLVRPGHIFPLQAKKEGVLARQGHTEGSIDLARLAGFKPAAVLCEIMNPDGTMAHGSQLESFAKQHGLTLLSIDDLVAYRLQQENLIKEEVKATLPIEKYGTFTISVVKDKIDGIEHIVLAKEPTQDTPLVRVHSSCVTGDLFSSLRCDCHQQLHHSLERISKEGGILIYLNQEGRGIGLMNKIKAYALQEQGMDTVEANEKLGLPADSREYYLAANILRNMKINKIRLLTNNPDKIAGLKKYGIENVARENMPVFDNEHNQHYLKTKKDKLGHEINLDRTERER